MPEQMTKSEARDYLPQWGSYMRSEDLGAVAYGAIPPETESDRDRLVRYLRDDCLPIAAHNGAPDKEDGENDSEQLQRAIAYLESLTYDGNRAQFIIEICPNEPRASFCGMNGESVANDSDIADCRASGDVQPACEYVRDRLGVEFRIVARNAQGEYENRLATDSEIEATARAIYFESESDFSDVDLAKTYLIWSAASDCEGESE